mmetsp:Transcript_41951/g.87684  ORF Transcript_41951/g.87684 Transcript_41951/m.87684 type:complete len:145 (+) Transcript_41951:59-493(+)
MDNASAQMDPNDAEPLQPASKVIERPAKARGSLSHMGMDKASDKRVRLGQLQKAKIVEYSVKNPSMKYQDVLEWAKQEFKLNEAPSASALCMWLKPETKKSLLDFLASQQAPRLMEMKGAYKSQYRELEEEIFVWFKKNEAKQA